MGWYELKLARNDQYHFVLKAGNGEVILSSEMYSSKGAAQNGIASVQSNAPEAGQYELKEATNGKYHFNLKAKNHQVIGSSQMYASQASAQNGIASVQSNGPSETIKDLTQAS
ncbi:YegP family protein [Aeromonas bivalvium]|uniref:YegP family protein n=1 Tax=Aeromonas bivalvium TaxID=440079 RepID=UPI0038D1F253